MKPMHETRSIPLLAPDACAAIIKNLMELRPCWDRLSPKHPYFKLGAAAYIEGSVGGQAYEQKAAQLNPVLGAAFDALYRRVTAALAETLGQPLIPFPRSALPGFHIFTAESEVEPDERPPRHVDLQYMHLPWDGMDASVEDIAAIVSFTLPLATPQRGTGLWLWDAEDWDSRVRFERYRAGELFLHPGDLWHQADIPFGISKGDLRITLQGHCVNIKGKWYSYF